MNHKQSSMAYGCLVFLTALSLASCSINQFNYRRIYSGAPLPRNEVAIVIKPDYCFITALEEDGKSPKQTPLLWGDIELLPGKYTLYIHWGRSTLDMLLLLSRRRKSRFLYKSLLSPAVSISSIPISVSAADGNL